MNKFIILVLIVLLCFGCEDTPDMCMEVMPSPVLYLGVDKYDSINFLIVTKTFSGDGGGSLVNSKIWDSIYFSGVEVSCSFNRIEFGDTVNTIVETKELICRETLGHDKLAGIFLSPEFQLFKLEGEISEFYGGHLTVNIPGYDPIVRYIRLVNKPVFQYPNFPGAGLRILPNDPLIIRWTGSNSSDLRLHLVIESVSVQGIFVDTICYSRLAIVPLGTGGFASSILYDNLLSLFNSELSKDRMITSRTIIEVFLEITTATTIIDPTVYRNASYVDYFSILSEGKQTVYGRVFSLATDTLKNLNLNHLTKEAIYSDPNLSDYHFTKW